MTYLTLKSTGLPKNRIIGMGGALDSSRFKTYLSIALNKPANDIQGMVIGGHGDTTMLYQKWVLTRVGYTKTGIHQDWLPRLNLKNSKMRITVIALSACRDKTPEQIFTAMGTLEWLVIVSYLA